MLARLAPIVVLLAAACSDPAELPDAFHVVEVPGSVVVTIDGGPCDELIADGSNFYIMGGPDSYSFSLSPVPSSVSCTWVAPVLTCDLTSRDESITLTVDGDRALVEAISPIHGTPACRMSMDATIEPL
jgi:hypothetical protein